MWCVSDDDDGVDNHHDSAMRKPRGAPPACVASRCRPGPGPDEQRIERLRTQALAAQGLPELLELDEAARMKINSDVVCL